MAEGKEQKDQEKAQKDHNRLVQERIRKLNELRENGIDPYPYSFARTHLTSFILSNYKNLKPEEMTKDKISIAGRVMQMRDMGKAAFAHLMDQDGRIQLYFRQDNVGKEKYKLLKKLDLGDFIGVHGTVFATRTGEISVYVDDFEILCKSIRPLPEKYHGLKDTELRYRMRYVDLIMNPDVRQTFIRRSRIVSAVREFMDSKGFLEVETPLLQSIYGGANARPFKTHHNALDIPLYMKISPELYLKRLVVGGFEKVYDLNKNFRNEGVDTTHNPEFTMMEFYQAYIDFNGVMELTEQLYEFVAKKVFGTTKFKYGEHEIDVKVPWKRLSMTDALKEMAGLDPTKMTDDELEEQMRGYNIEYEADFSRGLAIEMLFEYLCEARLIQPTFIIHHPKESTPLCKGLRGNPELLERVEPYICGMEIGNGYSELNDPILQRKLLEEQAEQLRAGASEAHPMDEDFVKAIEYGLPPTGGMGVAIDRMVMVMTNSECIRDVILFPTMKPDFATIDDQEKDQEKSLKKSLKTEEKKSKK